MGYQWYFNKVSLYDCMCESDSKVLIISLSHRRTAKLLKLMIIGKDFVMDYKRVSVIKLCAEFSQICLH